MGVVRTVIIAFALSLAPASIAFGASSPLDAVGEEHFDHWNASDDPSEPTEIEKPGTYSAFLQAPEDEDWYALDRLGWGFPGDGDGTDPACASVDFSGDVAASSHIWVPHTDDGYYATSDLAPVQDAVLALVVPAFSEVRFGLASEPVLGIGPHGSGSYDFTVDVHTIGELGDVDLEDGLPSCVAPAVPVGETVELDFEVDAPSTFTFSVAEGDGVNVDLKTPGQGTETLLLSHEDSRIVNTDVASGTHTLILENTGEDEATPLLGSTFGPDDDDDDDDEPNGRPCQPGC